jgi:hypothetical protein
MKVRFAKSPALIAAAAGLLLAMLSAPLNAQPADESSVQRPTFGYDKAHEITISGSIQDVLFESRPGSLGGMHVIMAGLQGTVDAHLGPFMTSETKEALHAGTPVQIVGAMHQFSGKDYLLVRRVIIGGRAVTVRSENGFLLQVQPRAHRTNGKAAGLASNGGAQ